MVEGLRYLGGAASGECVAAHFDFGIAAVKLLSGRVLKGSGSFKTYSTPFYIACFSSRIFSSLTRATLAA
jgi:hypothetical protein